MFKIAICDDIIPTTSEIEELLNRIGAEQNYHLDIDIFFDGLTLIQKIKSGISYDVIYLGIEMKLLDGIHTGRLLRNLNAPSLLIYISAYERYYKQLFEVEPFRFLLKPIDHALFKQYFLAACRRLEKKALFFPFAFNHRIYKILIADILYFESCGRYIFIHTLRREYRYIDKLQRIEDYCLKHHLDFLRIQQSFLINPYYIHSLCLSEVTLYNDVTLPVSKKYRPSVLKHYSLLAEELN